MVADVVEVPFQVGDSSFQALQVFPFQGGLVGSPVVLERAQGGHQHHQVGAESGLAALDVDKLLGAQIGSESGLGHQVVGQPQSGEGGDHGVAAMGDIGEGPPCTSAGLFSNV